MTLLEQVTGFENSLYYDITDGNNIEVVRRYDQEWEVFETVSGLSVDSGSSAWSLVKPFINEAEEIQKVLVTKFMVNMEFGREMVAANAADDYIKGKSTTEIKQSSKDFIEINSLLLEGKLEPVLEEIKLFTPTAEITREELDAMDSKLTVYLGF